MESQYSSPNDAALAVVATSMKKARLNIFILALNSILGGIFFSAGGFLYVGFHAENPKLVEENPGIANFMGAVFFGIGLFYVIITGSDLFNSNILFFSVGLMRGAVTIYDLIISWFVSWLGNIVGNLFVAYVFLYLSGSGASPMWAEGSRKVLENKLSFSFIQTFLKGIAGNFYVCLAVYLQLMAKPIHVRYIVMSLPIFTFVSLGYTHVVADMAIAYIGLLNGADVSVGKYIWKLLIPGSIGNIIGGSAFGIVIPYFMHLVVVEYDKKKLNLPEYDARDENPELNTDSRVVRVKSSDTISISEEKLDDLDYNDPSESYSNSEDNAVVELNAENASKNLNNPLKLSKLGSSTSCKTSSSLRSRFSVKSMRSPPGVFPVLGMGEPLVNEKIIQNGTYNPLDNLSMMSRVMSSKPLTHGNDFSINDLGLDNLQKSKTIQQAELRHYSQTGNIDIIQNKPGAYLERVITNAVSKLKNDEKVNTQLPITSQHNRSPDDIESNKLDSQQSSTRDAQSTYSIQSYLSNIQSSID